MLAVGVLLAIFLTLQLGYSQPLFKDRCTVVLVAGLAGDAESEHTYAQQLQDWIELACRSKKAEQVIAFCDAPESISPAAEAKRMVRLLKNERSTFLAETNLMRTNSLVFIAWGHGGKQGATPVLHVRGPRLTPDDFLKYGATPATSDWVLLFRGSGNFAKKLAAPNRRIISSDTDQGFTSDPVSAGLILKIARGSVDSFESVAAELGRLTARWYDERHLARTEEPALWTADNPPQLLAETGSASPSTAQRPESSNAAEKSPKETDDTAEKVNQPGVAWTGIQKVEPSRYPDQDAVLLHQKLTCRLGTDPALVTEQEEFIQVLTPEGKSFGDFDVSFSPPEEEIEFYECEVMMPDGKLVRLDPDRLGEARDQPLGDYRAEHRKFFSLPGVAPGAVIHVRHSARWKKFPLPQISMTLPLSKPIPVLKSSVEVSVPKQMPFHWAMERVSSADPAVKTSTYSTAYRWELTNLPPRQNEVLSPPAGEPRLLFSTFEDWGAFADWYARISRLTGEVTPEITAKAKELTAQCTDDRQRVKALYDYVTGLRYVAVPLGINSVRPHAAANVLKNQFGDCKDKANLLNSMLGVLKIPAHLVLVPRFSQAHDAVPGLAFNHAISQVKLGSDTVWLDTTDDVCRFGMLPPGDYGRKVLVVDGQEKALAQLPRAVPGDHKLTLNGEVEWDSSGQALPLRLKAVAAGYPDYELRTTVRETRERRVSIPVLGVKFRPANGSFSMAKQESTPVSALGEDFSWQSSGGWAGASAQMGKQLSVRSPFWLPKEWDMALHNRKNPLYLNQGYPLRLEERFGVELPAKSGSATLPRICENSAGPLRWRVEWARVSKERMEAQLTIELESGELTKEQTSRFQDQLRSLSAALAQDALITLE